MVNRSMPDEIEQVPEETTVTQTSEETAGNPLSLYAHITEEAPVGTTWQVRIIRAGWSNNGIYYSAKALQEALPLFDGAAVQLYDLSHLKNRTQIENPAAANVGFTHSPTWDGSSVMGLFECTDANLQKSLMANYKARKRLQESGKLLPSVLGLSIDALAHTAAGVAEGRKGLLCEQLLQIMETTVVSNPAAGGAIMALVAGLDEEVEPMPEQEKQATAVAESSPVADQQLGVLSEMRLELCAVKLERRLLEAKLPYKLSALVKSQFKGKVFEDPEIDGFITQCREAFVQEAAPTGVVQRQPDISLGAGDVEKLQASMDLMFRYNPNADKTRNLTEAEKQLYRDVAGSRLSRSIAACRERWFDDENRFDRIGQNALCRVVEATTADFAQIMGNSLNRATIQQYSAYPDNWRDLVDINPNVNDFKTQTRILSGGFSNLPAVSESDTTDTYPELSTPGEYSSTYAVGGRGGKFTITRAMVKNDDMSFIASIPSRIARGSNHQLRKFVYGLIIAGNTGSIGADTTYDGLTLYHASHANSSTTAMSQAAINVARTAIKNQRGFAGLFNLASGAAANATSLTLNKTTGIAAGDYLQIDAEVYRVTSVASGTVVNVSAAALGTSSTTHSTGTKNVIQISESIPLGRLHVIAPDELESTLIPILMTEQALGSNNNDINNLNMENRAGRLVPHLVNAQYLRDTNNWFVATEAKDYVNIEIAFMDDIQTPQIYVPTYGMEGFDPNLSRDNYRFKCMHEYSGAAVDYRGLFAALVAGG